MQTGHVRVCFRESNLMLILSRDKDQIESLLSHPLLLSVTET